MAQDIFAIFLRIKLFQPQTIVVLIVAQVVGKVRLVVPWNSIAVKDLVGNQFRFLAFVDFGFFGHI